MPLFHDHRSAPTTLVPEPSQSGRARTWRYITGAPVNGRVSTDSTFLRPATRVLTPTGYASRWQKLPGWKRAVVRLTLPPVGAGAPIEYAMHPTITLTTLGITAGCAAVYGARKVHSRVQTRKHRKELVEPLLRSLRGPLGLPMNATAEKWLMVPSQPRRPGQITRVWLPDEWMGEDVQKLMLTRLVNRWLDVPTEAVRWHLSSAPRFVEFSPTPQPPASVKWKPSDDPYRMHIGEDAHGQDLYLETLTDNPHAAFVGGSGSGKTTTLTLPLLHARQHGVLVDLIDQKRMSFTEDEWAKHFKEHKKRLTDAEYTSLGLSRYGIAGDPDRPSGVVTGIRIHTTIRASVNALAEFLASATAVALMQQRGEDTSHIPARVLLIDEFGSFAGGVKSWWKGPAKQKGTCVIPFWLHTALMQGRALDHRVMMGAHQLSLALFGDSGSDARDLFSGRVLVGDCSAEKWVTTFGRIKKPAWDVKAKGRGAYGALGATPSVVQVAYVSQLAANGILRALPAAPEWFDKGCSAPWLTEDFVLETEESYGAGRWVPGWEWLFEQAPEDGEDVTQSERDTVTSRPPAARDVVPVQRECDESGRDVTLNVTHDITVSDQPRLSLVKTERYTLASAAREGIIPMTDAALRKAKSRPGFPEGQDGTWTADELREWHRNRPGASSTASGE